MESNNISQDELALARLYASARSLVFLTRGALLHKTEAQLKVFWYSGQLATNPVADDASFTFTEPMVVWLPSPSGALGMMVAPMAKLWSRKHTHLGITEDELKNKVGVWFANLTESGIPIPCDSFGLAPKTLTKKGCVSMMHVKNSRSNAVQRMQQNYAAIAFDILLNPNNLTEIHEPKL